MHYRIENPSPSRRLGLHPGTAKEISHEEMAKIADAVAMTMSPVAQTLVNVNDEHGHGASSAVMGPAKNAPRVHCYFVDGDSEQEMTAKALLETYAEDIAKRKAAKKEAHAKRLADKRSGR